MKTDAFARSDIAIIVAAAGLDALMDQTIDPIATACVDLDDGRFSIPLRWGFESDLPRTGLLDWLPAMRVGERIVVETAGYHLDNPDQSGVPTTRPAGRLKAAWRRRRCWNGGRQ